MVIPGSQRKAQQSFSTHTCDVLATSDAAHDRNEKHKNTLQDTGDAKGLQPRVHEGAAANSLSSLDQAERETSRSETRC